MLDARTRVGELRFRDLVLAQSVPFPVPPIKSHPRPEPESVGDHRTHKYFGNVYAPPRRQPRRWDMPATKAPPRSGED
ncbi:hypothetical protein M0657_001298 [Pyricularia oryzae]|uniref:Uncharacterized protein n=3 Tax=Pyricularia oryzae TaxID=318829 RepID=A0A4P7NNK5_PYROR|nr:hypothetical protein OOU_Y34scaffold00576g31 [Pyricularia oryzae Y34]KAI7924375.1 hypothetical protein M9X92_003820 [Pyricularia oryzae]KAI7931344.1 hypothetical protein M0657_001298 [Pyricularia oryzae]QBZ63891.1 hypothetical protein PoMZ_05582 [Pyricularia oryzae]